ncbi:MAG: SDR family NAD(P)-dependent oxidoreductase [Desulfatiglandaceae bacterium]|jgi:NAD(P)-dependent dehydrogenase (short-subunit alcohol dehydrogenase family)
MDIKNSVAIITGGASGLGEATARALVERGGRVALLDLDKEMGERLASELGDAAIFCPGDVSNEKEVDGVVEKVKDAFGTFQIVVNCAGVGGDIKVVGKKGVMPLEAFNRTIQINLIGTFNVIRATASSLMENNPNNKGERGVYINTSSIAAYDGQVGQSAYSSSKGGIVSMTLTLAREFANNGIRIMTILPGVMDTPLLAKLPEKIRERLAMQVPFPPRLGEPSEFASLACHIVENAYLNGEHIRLDGGMRMGFGRK